MMNGQPSAFVFATLLRRGFALTAAVAGIGLGALSIEGAIGSTSAPAVQAHSEPSSVVPGSYLLSGRYLSGPSVLATAKTSTVIENTVMGIMLVLCSGCCFWASGVPQRRLRHAHRFVFRRGRAGLTGPVGNPSVV